MRFVCANDIRHLNTRPDFRARGGAMLRNKWMRGVLLAPGLFLCCAIGYAEEQSSPVTLDEVAKPRHRQIGVASFYHTRFHGRRTANGERYDKDALTACHARLPFGTVIRITNLRNLKSTEVRINDRNQLKGGRILDLSTRAARELDMMGSGLAKVELEVLAWGE
jgi:rare lipoprotein A